MLLSAAIQFFVIRFLTWSADAINIPNSQCRAFEEPRICGPACPITCDTLYTNVCCDVKCVSGCFCRDGYMLVSSVGPRKCVPINDCPKPGMLEFGNTTVIVLENAKVVVILVLRLNGSAGEIAVQYRTVEGSAKERDDFVPASGSLIFPDGVTFNTITIEIVDDTIREPDEDFAVVLSDPTNRAEINPRRLEGVRVIIKDDDMRPGYIEVLKNSITVPESIGTVFVTLTRVGGSDGRIRIQYTTADDTARAQLDYTPISGDVIFEDGEDRKNIQITIVDDAETEHVENFELQFFDPSPAPGVINFRQLSSKLTTVITIIDDDMKPGYIEVDQTTITVLEDIGRVNVSLVRLQGADGQIRIKYQTIDGSAQERVDYVPVTGEVVFNEGETRKDISLSIIDDDEREPVENVRLQLFDPSAADDVINFRSLSKRLETTITILDNDMKPGYIELPNPIITIPESIGTITINVVRVDGKDGEVRIRYRTVEVTASAASDYVINSGELVFGEGETLKTVTLSILNDDVREQTESFRFELFEPSAAPGVLNFRGTSRRTSTIITIVDDDMKPGYIELEQVKLTVQENVGVLQVSVVRLGGIDGIIRLKYRTRDGTANSLSDYKPEIGDLIFQEGERGKTIAISILNDKVKELSETFEFQIYDISPGSGTINFRSLGTKLTTLITITDDDEPGYVEMGAATISAPENAGTVTVSVVRVGGTDGILKVSYNIIDVSAVAGSDYMPSLGELVFNDGEKGKTITIQIIDDELREPVETFQIQLLDLTPQLDQLNFRRLGSKLTTVVSIIDNDEKPGYVEMGVSSLRAPEDAGTITVPVVRYGGSDGELKILYKIVDLSAVVGLDYRPLIGELIFKDGETGKTIPVLIIDDSEKESVETFQIQLIDLTSQFGQVNFRRFGSKLNTVVSIIDNDVKPGLAEFEHNSLTVREDIGVVEATVLRVDGTDGILLVKYKTVVGTAIATSDFAIAEGELAFQDGVDRQTLKIKIVDDQIKEPDETFSILIFEPDGIEGRRLGQTTSLLVTIVDNDNPGIFEFQNVKTSISENVGTLSVTVIRKEGSDGQVGLQIRTRGGTATEGVDYNSPSRTILFPHGIVEQKLQIQIIDDDVKETNENFVIGLFNPTDGGVLGENKLLTIVIIDDDDPSVIRFQRRSGNFRENVGVAEIPVIRENRLDRRVSVHWKTEDLSARAGEDYREITDELLIFEPNQRTRTIRVSILDDNQFESNELFEVVLFNPSQGAVLGIPSRYTVELSDDDRRVSPQPPVPGYSVNIEISFRLQNIRVRESAGEVLISIARSGPKTPLTVQIQTVDGSAVGGRDYKRTRGPVFFEEGDIEAVLTILIIDDDLYEPDETFTVQLLDASSGIIPLGLNVVTVTIEDDDSEIIGRRDGSASAVVSKEIRPQPRPQPGSVGPFLLTRCPGNLILKTCADTCPPTCNSMFGKVPCSFNGCIRACFCPDGLVKESESLDNCIKPSQCPNWRPPCTRCDGTRIRGSVQITSGSFGLL